MADGVQKMHAQGRALYPEEHFSFSAQVTESLRESYDTFDRLSRKLFDDYPGFVGEMMGTEPSLHGAESAFYVAGIQAKNGVDFANFTVAAEAVAPAYFLARGAGSAAVQMVKEAPAEVSWQIYRQGRRFSRGVRNFLKPRWEKESQKVLREAVRDGEITFEESVGRNALGEERHVVYARDGKRYIGDYRWSVSDDGTVKFGNMNTHPDFEGAGIYTRAVRPALKDAEIIQTSVIHEPTVALLQKAQKMGWSPERVFAESPLGRIRAAHWGFPLHRVAPLTAKSFSVTSFRELPAAAQPTFPVSPIVAESPINGAFYGWILPLRAVQQTR